MSVTPYDPAVIGRNIRALRCDRGCTQKELAHMTQYSTSTISALECGKRDMSVNMLFALCRALCCRPADLLEGQ